eukprot:m.10568 g.10568  ORF g.10568 m.10568 type:complete len:203 (-) comp2536_c0_seq1:64-672(-)
MCCLRDANWHVDRLAVQPELRDVVCLHLRVRPGPPHLASARALYDILLVRWRLRPAVRYAIIIATAGSMHRRCSPTLITGLDYFIGSSFSSIALNIIDRATMPGFATAYSGYIFGPDFNGQPFGAVDEAMFLSWIGGSLACLALQHWVTARMNIPSSREPLCASPEEDEEGRPLLAINRRGPPQRRTRTKYGTEDGYTSETA